jgi:sugar phosphate permease
MADSPQTQAEPVGGEGLILWVLWMTYGAFYFGRTNISAAVPGLLEEGLSKTDIGRILGGLKIAYAIGQLVNGQLAERFSARWLLAIGMLASALLNVAFGLATGLYFLLFIWACNGYCQALGWTPCMRVTANWIPALRRGRVIGILGTSYQATAALTYVIAGQAAHWLGWRAALYLPAALLAAAALHMLLLLRESPDRPRAVAAPYGSPAAPTGRWFENVWLTLSNPALWLLALTLFLLDACRYGFIDWGPTHLKEVQLTGIDKATLQYAILPLGGIPGAFLAGWATDRYLGGRRAPVICGLLLLLGGLTLLYDSVARASYAGTVALLVVIGFAIYGPQVLLVGTAPGDLARRGTVAAAAGFVNFMGYLGAYTGDRVTGWVVDRQGWQAAIFIWAGCAFLAALLVALLWNAKARPPHTAADRPGQERAALSDGAFRETKEPVS